MPSANRKTERKLNRKQKKHEHALEKELGIKCSAFPTRVIAVCNAGLVNGLSQDILAENFTKYGTIENIIMFQTKSYCFIVFANTQDAEKAFENTNGKLNIAQDSKPLYLLYSETIPKDNNNNNNFKKIPEGLYLFEDFISEAEETELLNLTNFKDDVENCEMKNRKVKHYGFEFLYGINNIDTNNPLDEKIPKQCDFLWKRLEENCLNFGNFVPDQLTVNCYKPGQGIPFHVDTHSAFEDPIVSLSLGSSIVMEFKKTVEDKEERLSIVLPRRSLLVLSGESRYNWLHGIVPRIYDVVPMRENTLTVRKRDTRISFTFRKIRQSAICNCIYYNTCDTYQNNRKNCREKAKNGREFGSNIDDTIIDQDLAVKLEEIHVHGVYENVAEHFSETRSKLWPNVVKFLNSLEKGSILIDVGCGNGKYLNKIDGVYSVGCDRSKSLLDICKTRKFEVFCCNCLHVPVKDKTADAVISIAVIHHLANESRRIQAIKEIIRILRINGQALIYVWAKEQIKNNKKSSYLKQDRKNKKENKNCEQLDTDVTERTDVTGVKQAADVIKTTEVTQTKEDIDFTNVKQAVDVIKTIDITQTKEDRDVIKTTEETQTKEDSDVTETTKVTNVKRAVDMIETIDETQTKEVSDVTETVENKESEVRFQLPVHENRKEFKYNDLLVPWKLKNKSEERQEENGVFLRYYHVFEDNELENLFKTISEVEIISSYYDQGNCCVLIKRVK